MMNLFRRKPAADPLDKADETTTTERAPSYEAWSPGDEPTPADTGPAPGVPASAGLTMAVPDPDSVADGPLAAPSGMAADHPLAQPIARALSSVYDPEIPVNIYELGLIYNVTVNEQNDAYIEMTLTAPGCPVAGQMPGMVEYAVTSQVEGIGDVEVEIVWDPPWTPDLMSEAAQLELGFM